MNRNGHYYLPKGWHNRRLPVMVILHGSGSSGNVIIGQFKAMADKYKSAIHPSVPASCAKITS